MISMSGSIRQIRLHLRDAQGCCTVATDRCPARERAGRVGGLRLGSPPVHGPGTVFASALA